MFDFNTYDMPSMFNSSLRNSNNRFSQRGNDIWSLFEDDYQPFYIQRPAVSRRKSPMYEDCDRYTAAEKPSLRYRNTHQAFNNTPNYFTNKNARSNFHYPANEVQPNRHFQPRAQSQTSTVASQNNTQIIENKNKKINLSLLSNFINSLMATIISIIFSFTNFLNSIPRRITAHYTVKSKVNRSILNDKPEVKVVPLTEEKKEAKSQPEVESKSYKLPEIQQPKPQPVKVEKKSSTQQSTLQAQSPQNKEDLVIIEDVTPSRPKWNPAMEPRRGLIIEEVSPNQL